MELNNIKSRDQILSALVRILRKIVSPKWVVILDERKKLPLSFPKDDDHNYMRFSELIDWAMENNSHSFYPVGDEIVGLLPMIRAGEIRGIIILGLNEEPKVEEIDALRVFSFLSSTVAENIMLLQELTEKNRLVEETMNYLHSILDTFPEMVIVVSQEGEIVYMNRRFVEESNNDEIKEKAMQIAREVIETGTRRTGEIESDGQFYSIVAEPLKYYSTTQAVTTIMNITSTKELEKLKQIDRMKAEFIANISHELRTPLAAIKAYSETILNSLEEIDIDTLKDFTKTIYEESQHLENLLNELLDFSKMERKALKMERRNVNVVEVIKSAVDSMMEYANSNKVKLFFESNDDVIEAYVDPTRIRQVALNLISNAIKYSKKEAENKYVRVKLEKKEDTFLLLVEDNGVGVPKDKLGKIFEKFYRVDSSLTYEVSGTGLGLSIVKEIVELHGGRVWVESEEGKGSTFNVEIPLSLEGNDGQH
ncbi:MAG: HAMP domain-containing histidine kinase [Thermotogaceae bacterium]|nr:HAMP domain-containing histidine kinase [Thermotogaceae bacterium]